MSYRKFSKRVRFFEFVLKEDIKVLTKEGDDIFMYCDPSKVPKEAKDDLAIILADMTMECKLKMEIGR